MPNTPALLGVGAGAYCMNADASKNDLEKVDIFMNSVGMAYPVKEVHMDSVTGVSGSGPAYVFIFIEALADGGVMQGVPRDVANKLAAQTVYGAAKMVLETGVHPCLLKDDVTTTGGTTINALH